MPSSSEPTAAPARRGHWTIGLGFALLGLLLGAGLLELLLRAYLPQPSIYFYAYDDGYVFNRPNLDGLFGMNPAQSTAPIRHWFPGFLGPRNVNPGPDYTAWVRTNARGQRDDVLPSYQKTPGRPRALILGDSISFGFPTPIEESYVKRLEALIPALETVNCSVIAVDTAQLSLFWDKECHKYDADVVLLQFTVDKAAAEADYMGRDPYGRDFRVIKALRTRIGARVLTYLRHDDDGVPYLDPSVFENEDLVDELRTFFSPKLPLYDHSALVRFVENGWVNRAQLPHAPPYLTEVLLQPMQLGFTEAPAEQVAVERTLRYLTRIRQGAEASGKKLVVVFTPTSYRARALAGQARADVEALQAAMDEKGFVYLDLQDVLRRDAAAVNLDELFYRDDYHPTARGYAYYAEAIAPFLRRALARPEARAQP